mmetsp:Transcript_100932/g.190206  ORF Transcript_100932/g.190206 Transcript_100932/m.190206 type:complete len:237 (-) Transcript_100932:283-993(-)
MDDPAAIATIACAAYVRPETAGRRLATEFEDGTLAKLRSVFNAAKSLAHDSIVLSAFGCGAFGNPPHAMASLMKQVCEEYSASFKKVVVAIVEDDGCQNLRPFQQVFNSKAENISLTMSPSISRADCLAESASSTSAGTDADVPDPTIVEAIEEEDSAILETKSATSTSGIGNNVHYSLQQLQDREIWSNLGIDPARRHSYLPDATFLELFEMSKDDFEKLPKWKAKQLKIKHQLY